MTFSVLQALPLPTVKLGLVSTWILKVHKRSNHRKKAVQAECLLWQEVEQHTTQRLTLEKTCFLMYLYGIKKIYMKSMILLSEFVLHLFICI